MDETTHLWDEEENETSIILPCPFCGGDVEENQSCNPELEYSLECKKCSATIYRDNQEGSDFKKQVIKAWNRRV